MTTMLYSGIPTYCPNCGRELFRPPFKRDDAYDWWAGCGHTCSGCGTHYRHVKEEVLEKVEGGEG